MISLQHCWDHYYYRRISRMQLRNARLFAMIKLIYRCFCRLSSQIEITADDSMTESRKTRAETRVICHHRVQRNYTRSSGLLRKVLWLKLKRLHHRRATHTRIRVIPSRSSTKSTSCLPPGRTNLTRQGPESFAELKTLKLSLRILKKLFFKIRSFADTL